MTHRSNESVVACPLCDTAGWPCVVLPPVLDLYSSPCGTLWGGESGPHQSSACRIIASLRFEVAILQITGEVAA